MCWKPIVVALACALSTAGLAQAEPRAFSTGAGGVFIRQAGQDNSVVARQFGAGSALTVNQTGTGNAYCAVQIGDGLQLQAAQSGQDQRHAQMQTRGATHELPYHACTRVGRGRIR